jgi:hypothetical protein
MPLRSLLFILSVIALGGLAQAQTIAPVPANPETPPPRVEGNEFRSRLSIKLQAGATYRWLYDISFGGAQLALLVGAERKSGAFYGEFETFIGSSRYGLLTSEVLLGFQAEARLGRFRLGGGIQQGFLLIRRVTDESIMWNFVIGPSIQGSFDVVRFGDMDEKALFIGCKGGIDWVVGSPTSSSTAIPLMLHVTAQLGVSF